MYLETCTPLAQKLAGEAFDAFETRTREDDTNFVTLKHEHPDWVHDAVMTAHGDFLPEDWRYDKIQDAFGAILDASEGADLVEVGDEFADDAVDTYTSDRLHWLASNLNRPAYCDEYLNEFGKDAFQGTVNLIGMGQYMEAREIFAYVVSSLADAVEAFEDA